MIAVFNHRSYFDVAAMALTIARTERTVRFLGKKGELSAVLRGMGALGAGVGKLFTGQGPEMGDVWNARLELEQVLGKRVFLQLHVAVREHWRNDERILRDLGIEG